MESLSDVGETSQLGSLSASHLAWAPQPQETTPDSTVNHCVKWPSKKSYEALSIPAITEGQLLTAWTRLEVFCMHQLIKY